MTSAPPLSTGENRTPDDVETILRSYFRAEMPRPWPAPPLTGASVQGFPARLGRRLSRSKLALAASLAVLVGGTLVLPGRVPVARNPSEPHLSPGEATRIRLTDAPVRPNDKPADSPKPFHNALPPGR